MCVPGPDAVPSARLAPSLAARSPTDFREEGTDLYML